MNFLELYGLILLGVFASLVAILLIVPMDGGDKQ